MHNRKSGGKITLGMLKGKSATTSVPSIRFNATAEEIEELFAKEEKEDNIGDSNNVSNNNNLSSNNSTNNSSDPEGSPLKSYLRLGKRSTSVDVSPIGSQDASPPTDSWKFFSDIRSKITKSVEGKITEYKSKKELDMDGADSPKAKDSKPSKEAKENTNPSESEDDESSISKTGGIVSTSDGVELSSDDETTSSISEEPKPILKAAGGTSDKTNIKEVTYAPAVVFDEEVEDAVEAIEDLFTGDMSSDEEKQRWKDFHEVDSEEFGKTFEEAKDSDRYVTLHPVPHIDLRESRSIQWRRILTRYAIIIGAVIAVKFYVSAHEYVYGFISGSIVTTTLFVVYKFYCTLSDILFPRELTLQREGHLPQIINVPSVEEHRPIKKYEGWVNEYPEIYNPHTYHISNTQTVYLKLKGNFLRISHTKSKIPKRALWNEPSFHVPLTHHRIYTLLGAKVYLLPEGLARGKRWSKKYPVCIVIDNTRSKVVVRKAEHAESSSQNNDAEVLMSTLLKKNNDAENNVEADSNKEKKGKSKSNENQLETESNEADADSTKLSNLADDIKAVHEAYLAYDSRTTEDIDDDDDDDDDERDKKNFNFQFVPPDKEDRENKTYLFIFGRTDREKEMWFRRLSAATHKGAYLSQSKLKSRRYTASQTLIEDAVELNKYDKLMVFVQCETPFSSYYEFLRMHADTDVFYDDHDLSKEFFEALNKNVSPDVKWLNCFAGRIMFECIKSPEVKEKVKDRIAKKLSAIKLPYFIEDLAIAELNLGHDIPLVHKVSKPIVDEQGLWVDFDISYSGLVVLILNTKLNLLKIKNKNHDDESIDEKSLPMYNSDVDDTAESSTDDEYVRYPPSLDATGYPVQHLGGTSNTSKKLIKMVDKVAESKLFQAATENKYIKRAIENVSNTELGLKVEIRAVVGTLVLNIPPPPSDRVWASFRPLPKFQIRAVPIVGERNISHLKVTNFIEKQILKEIEKIFVLPNMEDVPIPMMNSKLPE